MVTVNIEASAVRDLTDAEVAHFREHGWVFVKNYVNRNLIDSMLEFTKERMSLTPDGGLDTQGVISVKNWWWELTNLANESELFAEVGRSPMMGHNVQRLFQRDVEVHYLADSVMAKIPQGRQEGSVATSWHQDIPSFPFDRSGTLSCWMALDHLTQDMGTMHFLQGSQRGEYYGRIPSFEDPYAIFEYFPYLRDKYEEVASPVFEPGDATFHHCQVLHGAPANTGDRVRLSYTVAYMSGDCRYTGASCVYTDGLGLPIEEPVRHPRFPQIWPAVK
jgi:hypothetical protein